MRKIVDYKHVKGDTDEIERRVIHSMEEGWQPYGYIFSDRVGNLQQAMVRYEEEPRSLQKRECRNHDLTANCECKGGYKLL